MLNYFYNKTLPQWITKRYKKLWKAFGKRGFEKKEASEILKEKKTIVNAVLSQLKKYGWLDVKLHPTNARKRIYVLKSSKEFLEKTKPRAVLQKAEENPIILPKSENNWECWQVFNPGVILLEGKVHFLYRAIGKDFVSRIGYASSEDGFHITERSPDPIYEHPKGNPFIRFFPFSGGSFQGAEDPRIVRVNNEDTLYMTYTACDTTLGVALTSIKVKDFLNKNWNWKTPRIISNPTQVHKNWVIFPERINGMYAILHSINPITIEYRETLEFQEGEFIESQYDPFIKKEDGWESWLRGAGAPPVKTKDGWLLFYHGLDKTNSGRYKVGVSLLDLKDPTKVLCTSSYPILEPEEDYELNGFKPGIVYVTGAIVKNSELLVYYGASDSYVCVAHTNLKEFLDRLQKRSWAKIYS